jgi:tetratricopeptide (TPR) repeat protein
MTDKRQEQERQLPIQMLRRFSIRSVVMILMAGACLIAGRADLLAQNSAPQAPAQSDNPFPGEQPKTPDAPKPNAGQGSAKTQSTQTPSKPASDNPFPGEDSNAPIIPVDPGPGAGTDSGRAGSEPAAPANATAGRDADPDGDPVRTPDAPGQTTDDGFSSSRSGLANQPAEDDNDGRPGKSTKNKTREQVIQEDLDVGGFYIEKKNWKAAQARYAAAFALDGENADSVWGLAEAERHLGLYKEAAGHYTLFLSYDPDGPHSRAAKKALGEVEIAASSAKHPDAQNAQPK